MYEHDVNAIRSALDHCGLPIPESVVTAEAVLDAATALRVQVEHDPAPADVPLTDVKSVAKLHAAIVTHATTHIAALDAALRVEQLARSARFDTWAAATGPLMKPLGEEFTKAAATFTDAARKLGGNMDAGHAIDAGLEDVHRDATSAAQTLSVLRHARDTLASVSGPTGILPNTLDKLGRVIRVASMEHVTRVIPIRVTAKPGSPQWWASLAVTPGVVIEWHDTAEQIEMSRTLNTHATRVNGKVVETPTAEPAPTVKQPAPAPSAA